MALIDRIKFDAPSDDILVWKFSSEELKLGSQLNSKTVFKIQTIGIPSWE